MNLCRILADWAMRGVILVGFGIASAVSASAQAAGPATSAGPGRIICTSATACELGLGTPAKLKYTINIAGLPKADTERLVKQCTPKALPCVATVQGTEMNDPVKLKATSIKFYN